MPKYKFILKYFKYRLGFRVYLWWAQELFTVVISKLLYWLWWSFLDTFFAKNFTTDFLQTYKCASGILPKAVSVSCSVKKVFWSMFLSENLRSSGSTTWVEKKGCLVESGGTPARLSVKNMSLCLEYWGILDFKHR